MKPSMSIESVEHDAEAIGIAVEDIDAEIEPSDLQPRAQEIRATRRASMSVVDTGPSGLKLWGTTDNEYWRGTKTIRELPAGLYRCSGSPTTGPTLVKQRLCADETLVLPDTVQHALLSEFEAFWERKDWFTDRGFLHKRGIFLYGPPGSGKTSAIQLLVRELVEQKDGIVMLVEHPRLAGECLQMVREIEPTRPMIAILEDLDALVEDYCENEYLALLDGETRVDNIVFVATSNYPEKLDPRFTDRPSRFDVFYLMDMPGERCRDTYLKQKEPSLTRQERRRWVKETEGLSIAHLKEVIVSVRCLGQDFDETMQRLKGMKEQRPSSAEHKHCRVGFVRAAG